MMGSASSATGLGILGRGGANRILVVEAMLGERKCNREKICY